MIDKQSPIPLYYQLEEYIKAQIHSGELQPDKAIPSERIYAEMFKISRMTIRQALTNLVNQGYLYRQQGKGTFVNIKKVEQQLEGMTGFTEDMLERGFIPGSRLISFEMVESPHQVAVQLGMPGEETVYKIKRVRLANNLPIALETTYLPVHLFKDLTEEIINQSLYQYIEETLSLEISEATQEIEAATAKEAEIRHLKAEPGTPILLIKRTSCLKNNTPFEYVKTAYRADRYKFVHTMQRK